MLENRLFLLTATENSGFMEPWPAAPCVVGLQALLQGPINI